MELASLLFKGPDRHVTAESLHEEVSGLGLKVSLATVYNTLHQFTQAGLLRQVIVDAARGYFDTNTGDHQHFFLEDEGTLIDIPGEEITVAGVPHATCRPVRGPGGCGGSGQSAPDPPDVLRKNFFIRIILNC